MITKLQDFCEDQISFSKFVGMIHSSEFVAAIDVLRWHYHPGISLVEKGGAEFQLGRTAGFEEAIRTLYRLADLRLDDSGKITTITQAQPMRPAHDNDQ